MLRRNVDGWQMVLWLLGKEERRGQDSVGRCQESRGRESPESMTRAKEGQAGRRNQSSMEQLSVFERSRQLPLTSVVV